MTTRTSAAPDGRARQALRRLEASLGFAGLVVATWWKFGGAESLYVAAVSLIVSSRFWRDPA